MSNTNQPISYPAFNLIFTGALLLALGILALSSWYTHGFGVGSWIPELLQLQDGAALGFLLSGFALMLGGLKYWKTSRILAGLISLIGLLTLIQNVFVFDPTIDSWITLIATGSSRLGTVAANIGLSLFLIGIAIILLPQILEANGNALLLSIIGAAIILLGIVNFFVESTDIWRLSDWSALPHGNVTTALGLIVLGGGLITCAAHKSVILKYAPIKWLPVLVVAVVMVTTLILWQTLLIQKNNNMRRIIRLEADSARSEITTAMNARIYSLMRMANRWQIRGGTPKNEWLADAAALYEQQGGYVSIQWIDANLIVKWIVPLKGNEAVQNLKAAFEPTRRDTLLIAEHDNIVTISPTVDLIQKGQGFLIYTPLFNDSKFDGFIVAVVRYKDLFNSILATGVAPGYNIAIFEANHLVYQRNDTDQNARAIWADNLTVKISNITWRFEMWPSAELLAIEKSAVPSITLVTGLMISILLGLLIRLAQVAHMRSKETEIANQELKKEMAERERAEQEKLKLEKILLHNQKIQAIGTLAGGIAHDFNNILYSILGYVDMAKEDVPKDSRTRANLIKVLEVGKRGQELVSQILSFSRQQQYIFKSISLREVLESTLSLLRPTIPTTVNLTMKFIVQENDFVFGNHTQLQQVFVNIINNAVDAMNGEGDIEIQLTQILVDAELIKQHPHLKPINYYLVQIKDSGVGMDEATRERIFEPFFTTKEVGKGTGLGMSIAHGIIHDHGGVIIVDSELGKGTTFSVYLPEPISNTPQAEKPNG